MSRAGAQRPGYRHVRYDRSGQGPAGRPLTAAPSVFAKACNPRPLRVLADEEAVHADLNGSGDYVYAIDAEQREQTDGSTSGIWAMSLAQVDRLSLLGKV